MEKLKELLGEELYAEVAAALRGRGHDGKDLELAIANDGSFLPKAKFDAVYRENLALKEGAKASAEELAAAEALKARHAELSEQLRAYEAQTAEREEAHRQELARLSFDSELDRTLTAGGARNLKAVRALLDLDSLQENGVEALPAQLHSLREEAPYLFSSAESGVSYRPDRGAPPPDLAQMSDSEYYRYLNRKG